MESDKRNQQTEKYERDAKLTNHRKPVALFTVIPSHYAPIGHGPAIPIRDDALKGRAQTPLHGVRPPPRARVRARRGGLIY